MSKTIEKLEAAQRKAIAIRPKVGGFPYLVEALRQAGVTRNVWSLGEYVFLSPVYPGKPISTVKTARQATLRRAGVTAFPT